jgi:hypothetical protein
MRTTPGTPSTAPWLTRAWAVAGAQRQRVGGAQWADLGLCPGGGLAQGRGAFLVPAWRMHGSSDKFCPPIRGRMNMKCAESFPRCHSRPCAETHREQQPLRTGGRRCRKRPQHRYAWYLPGGLGPYRWCALGDRVLNLKAAVDQPQRAWRSTAATEWASQ